MSPIAESSSSWANVLPVKQGLYDPEYEKDACGVGFIVNISGEPSHKILSDASNILCNMTHRGAVGADARDGDGAGVMCAIPHDFFVARMLKQEPSIALPPAGSYAVGNIYLNPNESQRADSKQTFTDIANGLGLVVLGWRSVPRDNSILGPASLSKEPVIEQPFVTTRAIANASNAAEQAAAVASMDRVAFEQQLYILRKSSTHAIGLRNWFYICSLSSKIMVYKGQLAPTQVYHYYLDLIEPDFMTHFALVHSRFSTNTFPSWDRAQPMRWLAHNGEINTVRGNKNWMRAREGIVKSAAMAENMSRLFPIVEELGSDSSAFDNVLELLIMSGTISLPEAVMMMIPEAWENNPHMDPAKRAFYERASCLMEPWDGPALFTFSDGRYVGASLDRNGLRPCRFYITKDNHMICASEVGTLKVPPEMVASKGRLQPGRMLLVDTVEKRVVDDNELKMHIVSQRPYANWLAEHSLSLERLRSELKMRLADDYHRLDSTSVTQDPRLKAFGYSIEHINLLLSPMGAEGKEALGSMGTDTPLACLSRQPKVIYEYFKQLFAQVTNPPIDPIRESIVMSLECYIGPEGNILEISPNQCARLRLHSPILSLEDMEMIRVLPELHPDWQVLTVDITFDRCDDVTAAYIAAIDRVCAEVSDAIDRGVKIAILSDRKMGHSRVALSTLAVLGAVHHFLIGNKKRSRIALMVETGEAREVHHMCVLLGYGADAVCPYLAIECILKLRRENVIRDVSPEQIIENYKHSLDHGILKVMSKMGISTLHSYKGAQIFEAVGIDSSVINKCFVGTASRIKGIGFDVLAFDAITLHEAAFPSRSSVQLPVIPEPGDYHWRNGGEDHINEPNSIMNLQDAVRRKNNDAYAAYSAAAFKAIRNCTLRGMLEFRTGTKAVPIDEVEPWTSIVRRFCTGAMSYGSISLEAHSTLAIAMNRIGGKSNTGEGGEDPERSRQLPGGDTMRSAIKQVASGRFGVTSHYLTDADELQIKLAQGAKPGEGGELPGHKVSESIAKTRHSTPGVGLISPPPHHDIYSIEDLKQLIYDLKCSNPSARVSVKLVSEVGVGIVASGVVKAKADHLLISGHDGGTGASRWTGIKHAGLPWELGLAETHQTLVLNNLRGRVVVQTDGQIKTGRDVAIACLLGAEEWGFATTPLIAMGCTMMRKCHLNTCPVGIATQDPELRKKFEGKPEDVINFFYYVAEELRGIMARLGFRSISEMVGRTDMLVVNDSLRTQKTMNLDLSSILTPAYTLRGDVPTCNVTQQDHNLQIRLDNKLIRDAEPAILRREPVKMFYNVVNTDRSVGVTLSHVVSKNYGPEGLPSDTIHVKLTGSAGQSLGGFLASGITLELEGDSNDYVGKGLSGGRIIVYPPKTSTFAPEENIIVGNVCLYGATSGEAFISGIASERFAVRNSGAIAVIEGVGDHGCEYMTGGCVVVLGRTGRNFAAGMSGGIAYVLDPGLDFATVLCNTEMVSLDKVGIVDEAAAGGDSIIFSHEERLKEAQEESNYLRSLIEKHYRFTGSKVAARLLETKDWSAVLERFVKVFPLDYKEVLRQKKIKNKQQQQAKKSIVDDKEGNKENVAHTAINGHGVQNGAAVNGSSKKDHHHHDSQSNIVDIEDVALDEAAHKKRMNTIASSTSAANSLAVDKVRGFAKYQRKTDTYRNPRKRIRDWLEINARLDVAELKVQGARCMDCGVPFCQGDTGCPIGNIIPKWNELVYKNQWREALDRLLLTNNFPEFTGRVCPAPCEGACVLGINELPVSIKSIECAIIDRAFDEGWMVPRPPSVRTGKRVAIVGSGPAGLAAADQLNKAGHLVTVYDRNDRIGGLLMYGIPNMKLDKRIVQRRIDLMAAEGVQFVTNAHVGKNVDVVSLRENSDALLLATGATWPRDLPIPGRQLDGIHFAMEFLQANTKSILDNKNVNTTPAVTTSTSSQESSNNSNYISAAGKNVIVIGGGDTGCDCIGTSMRHGAKSVVNFELLPQPPAHRANDNPWPQFPRVFKVDYGHAEVEMVHGKDPREYQVLSKDFVAADDGSGAVKGINTVRVEWTKDDAGRWQMKEVPGSEKFYPADLVLIAMGFLGPEADLMKQLGVQQDPRSNIKTSQGKYATNLEGVFAAGDCRRGQSLIVWGINEGRQAARDIDEFLMGDTVLPVTGGMMQRNVESMNVRRRASLTAL